MASLENPQGERNWVIQQGQADSWWFLYEFITWKGRGSPSSPHLPTPAQENCLVLTQLSQHRLACSLKVCFYMCRNFFIHFKTLRGLGWWCTFELFYDTLLWLPGRKFCPCLLSQKWVFWKSLRTPKKFIFLIPYFLSKALKIHSYKSCMQIP